MKDYSQHVINEYINSPKYIALVKLLTNAIQANKDIIEKIPARFNIDVARGDQLDILGMWIGLSRNIFPAINDNFFTFGRLGYGYGQKKWKNLYDETGISVLSDKVYRLLLKSKISINHFKGSIPEAIEVLNNILGTDLQEDILQDTLTDEDILEDNLMTEIILVDDLVSEDLVIDDLVSELDLNADDIFQDTLFNGVDNKIILADNQNMSYYIGIIGSLDLLYSTLITRGYFDIKPSGVKVTYIRPSSKANVFFGFGLNTEEVKGWGQGYFFEKIPNL